MAADEAVAAESAAKSEAQKAEVEADLDEAEMGLGGSPFILLTVGDGLWFRC